MSVDLTLEVSKVDSMDIMSKETRQNRKEPRVYLYIMCTRK